MGQQYDKAQQDIRQFTTAHPELFEGLDPRNIIAHLGKVAPGLWGELNSAYNSEIGGRGGGIMGKGDPTLNEWGFNNPTIGQSLLQALPPAPPSPVTDVPPNQVSDPTQIKNQTDQAASDYSDKVNAIYDQLGPALTSQIQTAMAPGRKKLIDEEASLGRLTSPASIPGISNYDAQTQNQVAGAQANLLSQKASGQLDLTKTIQGILQSGRDASQQESQFERGLQLNKDTLMNQINQSNLDRQLSSELGRMTADANKPTWADNFSSIATPIAGIGGSILGGPLGGAIASYLTKRGTKAAATGKVTAQ